MTIAAANKDTGMVTAGISVARVVPRNRMMITSTINKVSVSTVSTFFIDSATNTVKSRLISPVMSLGKVRLISASSARTASETSSTFALEVGTTPMLSPGSPLERARLR